MGWFESTAATEGVVRCKKHPKHRQSPGVCSYCLRERLTQISNNHQIRSSSATSSSSVSNSTTPYYSSDSSSSSSSSSTPVPINYRRRNSISVTKSYHHPLSFLINGKDGGLMRSRSMAFVAKNWVDTSTDDHQGDKQKNSKKKKKKGSGGSFWSKLIGGGSSSSSSSKISSRKKKEQQVVLMHCKTVKETRRTIPFF